MVQTVINAVCSFAYALDDFQKQLCPNHRSICPAMTAFDLSRLFDHLKNVSFLDSANDTMRARYDIMNFREENSQKRFVTVNTWRFVDWNLDGSLIINDVKCHGGNTTVPSSYSSLDCPFGYIKKSRYGYNFACCWKCHACEELNIIVNNTCVMGPADYIPNANRPK